MYIYTHTHIYIYTFDTNGNMNKETYSFKSKHHPGVIEELEKFEKELFGVTSSLKFQNITVDFKKPLKEDIPSIISSPDVLTFADERNNIYKTIPEHYNKNY